MLGNVPLISMARGFVNLLTSLLFFKVDANELGAEIGCAFNNDQWLGLLPFFAKTEDMTNLKCARICCSFSTNMKSMGTQIGDECLCKTEFSSPTYEMTSATNCNTDCIGNSSQKCGGYNQSSVFGGDIELYLSLFHLNCSYQPTNDTLNNKELEVQMEELMKENAMLTNLTFYKQVQLQELLTENSVLTNSTTFQQAQLDQFRTDISTCKNVTLTQLLQLEELQTNMSNCRNLTSFQPINNVLTKQQLEIRLAKLKVDTSIEKKNTTLARNKKSCAVDNRKSARNIGILGCIVILFPVVLIVVNDVLSVFKKTE